MTAHRYTAVALPRVAGWPQHLTPLATNPVSDLGTIGEQRLHLLRIIRETVVRGVVDELRVSGKCDKTGRTSRFHASGACPLPALLPRRGRPVQGSAVEPTGSLSAMQLREMPRPCNIAIGV